VIHMLAPGEHASAANGVVRHPRRGDPPIVEVRGLLVTSVARTVVDLAALTSFAGGVVAADRALSRGPFADRPPLCSHDELEKETLWCEPSGRERARDVVRFADGRSESPLESVSRVSLHFAGAPPPLLQVQLPDLLGVSARLDFAWPELGIAGEADGSAKGVHPVMLRGRTTSEFLREQAQRERRIEAAGLRVMRWGWDTGRRVKRMKDLLVREGFPLTG